MKGCPICQTEPVNEKLLIRARTFATAENPAHPIWTFEAFCPNCELFVKKTIGPEWEGIWELPEIPASAMITAATLEDLEKLESEIDEYPTNTNLNKLEKQRGEQFLSVLKESDKVLKITEKIASGQFVSFAIKRGEFVVARYFDIRQLDI
ncbi:hypothetical protein [Flavobacterium sp.]|uniref:hypothetical protein n=1 Tax=Flavobacterium sp. TaxID=239 RepID=UPI00122C0B39|nr:hypothetical protein [Flavobacterium sp.]RZJ72896.1 MAG: hypothetical protein EOO49_04485 [Flavobacterium sp.]